MDIYSTEGNKLEDFHKVIWDQVSDEARMIRQQKGYPRGGKKKKEEWCWIGGYDLFWADCLESRQEVPTNGLEGLVTVFLIPSQHSKFSFKYSCVAPVQASCQTKLRQPGVF